jgi:putative DNA primase/helicase
MDAGHIDATQFQWLGDVTGIHKAGSLDGWIETVKRASDRPDWILGCTAGFIAPVISIVGDQMVNPVIEFFGTSSQGKTIAIQYAASVWGNPSQRDEDAELRFMRDWNGTPYAVMQQIARYRHLPCCIDEATTAGEAMSRTTISQIIYGFSQGMSKAQGKADGGLRQPVVYQGALLTSSEVSLTDHLRTEGTMARLISIEAFGTSTFQWAEDTKILLCQNFGWAGPAFMDSIINYDGGIQRWAKTMKKRMKQIAPLYQSYDPVKNRAGGILTLLHAMAEYISHIFKLEWDVETAFKKVNERMNVRGAVRPHEAALVIVRDYYVANRHQFERWQGQEVEKGSCLGKVVDRPRAGTPEHIAFIPTKLRECLEKHEYNMNDLLRSWDKKGVLVKGTDGYTTRTTAIAGTTIRCVCIKMDEIEQGEDSDAEGADSDAEGAGVVSPILENTVPRRDNSVWEKDEAWIKAKNDQWTTTENALPDPDAKPATDWISSDNFDFDQLVEEVNAMFKDRSGR